jgi:2-polyprenyl-6-methoxyphenol hydroxylase-like FAD-dependent oxidoreductase
VTTGSRSCADPVAVDVVIVGAGPAGAAHTLAVLRAGGDALLVGPPPRHRARTLELLSGRARHALAELGLLDTVTTAATPCAGVVSRWDGPVALSRPALLDPYGGGWIVDRARLDADLLTAVADAGGRWTPHRVEAAEPVPGGWQVRLADRWQRCTRLVVATGRTGRFAARCGIHRTTAHRLVAAVGWLPVPLSGLGDRLSVAALPDGWWYWLGRGAGTALGFCTDVDLLPPGPDRLAAVWAGATAALDLPRLRWPEQGWSAAARQVRPWLRDGRTGAVTGAVPSGISVLGDAAVAVDPLSGHGLALAFESAWRAAADPAGYPRWLAAVTAAHLGQQRAVYTAAGQAGEFWRRRSAVPVVADGASDHPSG